MIAENLACSRLSDSGKTRKKKVREKLAGWEKRKRKGERACNHLFYDPLPPTFGTFEMIRFRLSNCWNVNELESFSNFSRDYFARCFSLMRGRAIWSVKSESVGNTRLLPCPKMLLVPVNIFSYRQIMLWRGLHFDRANYVIFAACFMLPRSRRPYWFSEVIISLSLPFSFFPPRQLFANLFLSRLPNYLRAWNRLEISGKNHIRSVKTFSPRA